MAVSTSLLMASKTLATNPQPSLLRRNATPLSLRTLAKPTTLTLSLRRSKSNLMASSSPSPLIRGQNPTSSLLRRNPTPLSLRTLAKPTTLTLSLRLSKSNLMASSSPSPQITGQNPTSSLLRRNPTPLSLRTLAKPTTLTLSLRRSKSNLMASSSPSPLITGQNPPSDGSPPGSMFTLIAVIAPRLAWLVEMYLRLLQLRIFLSVFPNIQWDKQPMSTIRYLCDPALSLFRRILPPWLSDVLLAKSDSPDISPVLAFILLGMLQFFCKPRGSY